MIENDAHVHVRCSSDLKERFTDQCNKDDREPSAVIRNLMTRYTLGELKYQPEKSLD